MNWSLLLKILGIVLAVIVFISWFLFRFAIERDAMFSFKPKIKEDPEDPKSFKKSYHPDETEEKFFYDNAYKKEVKVYDGLKLTGYLLKAPNSHRYIIMCHGYTSSHKEMIKNALYLNKQGFNCLLPDARAHGDSKGRYRGMGYLDRIDLMYWLDMLMKADESAKVCLYGRSMGASEVMFAASEKTIPDCVKCVIEDSGFANLNEEFKYGIWHILHIPSIPFVFFASELCKAYAKYTFEEADLYRNFPNNKKPTLFIHGTDDKLVPKYNVDDLYDICTAEKELYIVEGVGHCKAFCEDKDKYYETMINFIKKYM